MVAATKEVAMTITITPDQIQTETSETMPSPRRRVVSKKVVAGAVTLAVMIGASGGILAGRTTSDPSARAGEAWTARLQAEADAHLARVVLEHGRAADSARWQAQADAYHARVPAGR
jgi:hypothetical protein